MERTLVDPPDPKDPMQTLVYKPILERSEEDINYETHPYQQMWAEQDQPKRSKKKDLRKYENSTGGCCSFGGLFGSKKIKRSDKEPIKKPYMKEHPLDLPDSHY